jgi:hypothetical protein
MPTADRRRFVPVAIRLFLEQAYEDKELIIVDDGVDRVEDLVPNHPQIRYIPLAKRVPLGTKRNLACEAARGEIIVHWDDDDWHAPWRLRYQVDAMEHDNLDLCGLDRVLFFNGAAGLAWEYLQPASSVPWVCGATLCYRKSFWRGNPFPDIHLGEDSRFVFAARRARIRALDDNRFLIARIHDANSHPKRPRDARWTPLSPLVARSVIGCDWEDYFGGDGGAPLEPPARNGGTALVTAASGIGDILRVTPLIRVVHRLGFEVDVLIRPDDPAAADLLRGAREIRRLFVYPYPSTRLGPRLGPENSEEKYDIATFTLLSGSVVPFIKAARRYPAAVLSNAVGEVARTKAIADELGWLGDLPSPFAMKSTRRFSLPRGTIALHPGCKASWPWKKWHGFDELAACFEHVAIVGTAPDLDNHRSYFKRPFQWPPHVRSFVGELGLCDTAALLSQCRALVSIDSGLMHLGVALAVPTFGIFGITSADRECIPSPYMTPITKGLPCEPACRLGRWGRRDCERHVACLKMLTPQEVVDRITAAQ